jgi:hypothetical protein
LPRIAKLPDSIGALAALDDLDLGGDFALPNTLSRCAALSRVAWRPTRPPLPASYRALGALPALRTLDITTSSHVSLVELAAAFTESPLDLLQINGAQHLEYGDLAALPWLREIVIYEREADALQRRLTGKWSRTSPWKGYASFKRRVKAWKRQA